MEQTQVKTNFDNLTPSIAEELEWFRALMKRVLQHHFSKEPHKNGKLLTRPDLSGLIDPYAKFINTEKLSTSERLLLILGLAPHISPVFLDEVISSCINTTGDFPQLGGVKGQNYRGFLPTLETALFLLSNMGVSKRSETLKMLKTSVLLKILSVDKVPKGEPLSSGKLIVDQDFVELITLGRVSRPSLSIDFPAQYISTNLTWEDLVLNDKTMLQIVDLENWIKYNDILLNDWQMRNYLMPGYRVLFFGPPGTGKTLTAKLLGKFTGREVFRVDLSMVVSKYIGETEKNLSNLFDKAEDKNWILFFDEADALFGKRTNVRDAHDKYANQEVSFLLQRTENYPGLVILASNFKGNIDESFARRFQSHVYFPLPKFAERLKIWHKAIPESVDLDTNVNLTKLAKQYELTGANIMNVIQYACLKSLSRETNVIINKDLTDGIEIEFNKEGKMI